MLVPRKPSPAELIQFNIRMPKSLIALLDAEVAEALAKHPGRMTTRSDLIREVLYEHVKRREERAKKREV